MGIFQKLANKIILYIYSRGKVLYEENRYDSYRKKYQIESNFRFNGNGILFYGNGKIVIGKKSYVGSLSTIQATPGHCVKIGNRCQISHNVRMYPSSADPDQDFTIQKTKPIKAGDITIGDGVWIGANVFIGPGITIGNNAVIGANSMVTKNIPQKAIFGGVPAKLIRYKNY